jgi:hypothetical protein
VEHSASCSLDRVLSTSVIISLNLLKCFEVVICAMACRWEAGARGVQPLTKKRQSWVPLESQAPSRAGLVRDSPDSLQAPPVCQSWGGVSAFHTPPSEGAFKEFLDAGMGADVV